jgi:hypothetical protein
MIGYGSACPKWSRTVATAKLTPLSCESAGIRRCSSAWKTGCGGVLDERFIVLLAVVNIHRALPTAHFEEVITAEVPGAPNAWRDLAYDQVLALLVGILLDVYRCPLPDLRRLKPELEYGAHIHLA